MKYPHLNEERKLWNKGYNFVAGLDEAGRGPLAGPVVAAAVILKLRNCKLTENCKLKIENWGVKDSKQLTEKQREKFYKILTKHPQIKWGIGVVSEKIIDKINILEATKLAMQKAIKDLDAKADFLILDGNFSIRKAQSPLKADITRMRPREYDKYDLIPQKSVVRGDEKVFSCAAASIIAKVTRDRMMLKYDKKYPNYGFKRHKGYPTKAHFANLEKFGPCQIHRKSFIHTPLFFNKAKNVKIN